MNDDTIIFINGILAELRVLGHDYALEVERRVNAEADRDAYRLLSQQLLHHNHNLTIDGDRRDLRHRQLLEEYRRVRIAATGEAVRS